jgi:hypothetical protein
MRDVASMLTSGLFKCRSNLTACDNNNILIRFGIIYDCVEVANRATDKQKQDCHQCAAHSLSRCCGQCSCEACKLSKIQIKKRISFYFDSDPKSMKARNFCSRFRPQEKLGEAPFTRNSEVKRYHDMMAAQSSESEGSESSMVFT